ncbi:hypothetical protein D9M69_562590 [compost metagenome]
MPTDAEPQIARPMAVSANGRRVPTSSPRMRRAVLRQCATYTTEVSCRTPSEMAAWVCSASVSMKGRAMRPTWKLDNTLKPSDSTAGLSAYSPVAARWRR